MIQTVTGALGVLSIAVLTVVGLWSFVSSYVLESSPAFFEATLASLGVVVAFVFVLFVLGARSDDWLETPYW